MSEWYYAIDGQRYGPVALDEVLRQAAAGRLKAADTVWTVGRAAWEPATSVPGVRFGETPAAVTAPVLPARPGVHAPEPVAYFRPGGELPPRAAAFLARYAPPTGDTGVWPLDDGQLGQFGEANRQRRRVRSAQNLMRLLCALVALAVLVDLIVALAQLNRPGSWGLFVLVSVLTAIAVLYGLASVATGRNRVWGCWAVFGVLTAGMALEVFGLLTTATSNRRTDPALALGAVVGLVIGGLMLATIWRGIAGIKAFRATPAWCQEAVLRSETNKGSRGLPIGA